MRIDRRRVVQGAVVAGVLAAVALIARPDPVAVEVRGVDRGPLRVTVDEDGETRVRDRYLISAPVTGRLARLEVEAGDSVAAGQVIARIHPLPLDSRTLSEGTGRLEAAEAAQRAAEAAAARAREARDDARRTRERLERVAADVRGAVSEQRLDDARTTERAAELAVEEAAAAADAAGHDVEAARAALVGGREPEGEPTLVRSPVPGRLLRVCEECERVVTAGTAIAEVGDPGALEVVVDVLTEDAARLAPGAAVRIASGPEADTVVGTIRRIEPSAFTKVSPLGVEEQRVNVVVTFEGADVVLGDRYRVAASLVAWEAPDVLRVPVGALFRVDGGWGVFVVDGGRARLRPVELGHRGRRDAEVLDGLTEGEAVVVYPGDAVEDGVRVKTGPSGASETGDRR